jgi:hypothetical protein
MTPQPRGAFGRGQGLFSAPFARPYPVKPPAFGLAGLQSRGQWGARDFDKVMFTLPIPRFDSAASLHRDLAKAVATPRQLQQP